MAVTITLAATACSNDGLSVETGRFGAMMQVRIENDGPVTLIVRTGNRAQ